MVHPCAKAHGGKLGLGAIKGIGDPRNLHREGHVFQGGHRGDQVKALEHHPHPAPTEPGQLIFIHAGQILPQGGNLARGCPL